MIINIFYASWFGNGKKVVEELSGILKNRGQDVRLFNILEADPENIPVAGLFVFSSPTRKFSLPTEVKNFILNFKIPENMPGYALMTTYLDPRTIALKKMEELLNSRGMEKSAESLKVKALGLKGPLEEGYKDRLEAFAGEIIKGEFS